MPDAIAYEQYLLELINADRARAGVQALAFDRSLNAAAKGHSRWMIGANTLSHTGAGGSTAAQRMRAVGYRLTTPWETGENVGWVSLSHPSGLRDEVQVLHANLMNSPGHRANLLKADFRGVGLGFETGGFQNGDAAMVTQKFARSGTAVFLTGVAFHDSDRDRFYDPGEGLGGVTVTAVSTTGSRYSTATIPAGGYDLVLPAGSYTVTFSGAGIETSERKVTIGSLNVKLDLIDPAKAEPRARVIAGGAGGYALRTTRAAASFKTAARAR